jgi:hypothetical protein
MKTSADRATERERREKLRDMMKDAPAEHLSEFAPGTFGCHELLDRLLVVGDTVEEHVLDHPACLANAEWYGLANQAVKALRELYQRVGAAHLENGDPESGTAEKAARRRRTA